MMAVPFAIPEDEINNLITAVIFILTQTRLERSEKNHKLQECMEELVRLLVEELERRSRSSQYDNQLKGTLLLLHRSLNQFTVQSHSPTTFRRPTRSRSTSESSCCEDPKLAVHQDDATVDCSQVGLVLRKVADYETPAMLKEGLRKKEFVDSEPLLSRLVPGVRRTFWTAVPLICMVGWHLFQTNYCM